MDENPYLPEPPADGKHIFNGGYRCVRCGVYNREDSPPFHEPCKGRWAESGKMRYAAEDRWAAEQPAVPDPTVEALSEVERDEVVFQFYNAATSGEAIETVERILAARAAAPDALRVRIEALAAEWEAHDAETPLLIDANPGQTASILRAQMRLRQYHVKQLRALLEDGGQ